MFRVKASCEDKEGFEHWCEFFFKIGKWNIGIFIRKEK